VGKTATGGGGGPSKAVVVKNIKGTVPERLRDTLLAGHRGQQDMMFIL
jgi:hypothetical protein